MSPVLGLSLDDALSLLKEEGYTIETVEVSSKKGTDGTDPRVISFKQRDERTVILHYAFFVTELTD